MNAETTHKATGVKGFSLVELLVVVVVIVIIATIVVVAYNGIGERSRITALTSSASSAAAKLDAYSVQNSRTYPDLNAMALLGIEDTDDAVYRYSVGTDYQSYCLTVADGDTEYYVRNTSITPTEGRCSQQSSTSITNRVSNPSMESNSTGHTHDSSGSASSSATRTTSGGLFGNSYLTINFSSSGTGGWLYGNNQTTRPNVSAGTTYVASAYVKTTVAASITPYIIWYNNSGTEIGTRATASAVSTNDDDWTRIAVRGTAPTGATDMSFLYRSDTSVWTSGKKMRVDGVMLTSGNELYPYRDGTFSGWSWSGSSHSSTSSGPSG